MGLPNLSATRSKIALPRSCACVSSLARQSPAIRPRRETANIDDQIGKSQIIVVFCAPEVLFRPRSALRGQVRITAVPLVRLGVLHIFDGTVVDDVATEAVRLQIPIKPVKSGVDVAVGAADLALERLTRRVESLLAVTQNGQLPRTFERNCRGQLIGSGYQSR